MLRRIRDYALALVAVLAVYVVYAQTVGRMIEPARITYRRDDRGHAPGPTFQPTQPFEHLFQPGDWELESPKVIQTSQGTLLFQDYRPLEQGRLEIRPCTLILYSQGKQGEVSQSGRPVVMRAHEGAWLQFDSDVDLSLGQFGRLLGGRILGDIRLFSPETSPGAGDGLELLTRNLQIDRLKAFTPSDVKFRYGGSYGSGRDLVLMLAPSETLSGGKGPPIGGVESVQLTQVHELHLEPQRTVLVPGGESQPANEPQPPVRITCDGPLKFDVNRRVATLNENVLLERVMPQGPPDRLRCEQLAIFLTAEGAAKPPRDAGDGPISSGDVERVVAVGKPVILEAPSQNAHTEAERLEYNLKTRQIILKSLKSGANVRLRRGSDEFAAPELVYEMVEGKRIGKLWAPGPGRLLSSTGEGENKKAFTAQWQKEIRIRPHDGNQLVSLSEGAKIEVEGQGTFEADNLHLWLTELPSSASDSEASADPLAGGGLLPDRLLATGHVQATSPQLSADAERLEVWFKQIEPSAPASPDGQPDEPQELSLTPPSGQPPPLRQPLVRIQEPGEGSQGDAAQHFHVTGSLISLQVEQRGKESAVEQISVTGPKVRIVETNPPPGERPLAISGTRLDLTGAAGADAVITVSGKPASIAARGMSLQSEALQLSRRDHRVTVQQAGIMLLPVEQDMNGQQLAAAEELSIRWQGSLVFDGSVAKFRRGVVVRGGTYLAMAEELQAVLSSQINFSQPKSAGAKPEIKRLVMNGGAQFENRTYTEEGRQQSVERMIARSLDVDRVSGALLGEGPGWLSRVQVGSAELPGAPPPVDPPAEASTGLTYLRVYFRQQLKGNVNSKQVEFADQVQAVTGPISHWDETVDPNQRDALGERGMILTCDALQLAEFLPPGAKKGSVEMTSLGNTRVEGRDFTAWAHRLTYAAAKSQLVLEGDGRNNAEIKHQYKNSVAAKRFVYWQSTGAIQIDDAESINLGPTTARPATPPRSPRDFAQPR